MIRFTTPTSAGWAQAADTSGMIQALEAEQGKRHQRFEKNIKDFDSSSVWHRDIPEFTNKVNEYYKYISENYDALSNKTRNLDKYYEMKGMENELQNFSVASKAMGQNVDRAQKLMLDKPSLYDNPENQKLIDDQITGAAYGTLAEGYKSGQAHNASFMQGFNRNILLDINEITDELAKDFGTEDVENVETYTIAGQRKGYKYPIKYDEKGIIGKLEEYWQNGYTKGGRFTSGTDIQRKYETFEAFADAAGRGMPEFTQPEEYTERLPSEKKDKPVYTFHTEVRPVDTQVGGHAVVGTEVIEKNIFGKPKVEQDVTENYSYNAFSQGNVAIGGTKSVGARSAGKAIGYDMRDGQMVDLTNDKYTMINNVSYSTLAESSIHFDEIIMLDPDGNPKKYTDVTMPPGAPLSEEMVKAIKDGSATFTDETGLQKPLSDTNAHKHVYYGPVAFSRTTSAESGVELDNPYSWMASLDETQYRIIAQKYNDEFKQQVNLNPLDFKNIEEQLNTIDQANPFLEPADGFTFSSMAGKGKASAFNRKQ